ncbi:MAG: FAA hydrolase family protein [Methanobacteriota archaeon]|nr:MAG: FAA hydrolase family protein [Euryarchaeota archaeon]
MKIARIRIDGKEFYSIHEKDGVKLIEDQVRNDLGIERFLLEDDFLQKVKLSDPIDISKHIEWLPPISRPGKIICIGRNYMEHITEQGKTPEGKPLLFSKYPSNMVGHKTSIDFPKHGKYLDYEVELAVIIGKEMQRGSDPWDSIFGYTVANDLTVRDVQKSEKQWTRGKAFDQSLPIGPWIVTADEIQNPKNLRIWLDVDGERRQEAVTSQMIYPIDQLLTFISEAITLYPGDIVLTGTPSGVGYYMEPKQTLQRGSKVVCGVEGIGTLEFHIR